jgi:hypothetical protein
MSNGDRIECRAIAAEVYANRADRLQLMTVGRRPGDFPARHIGIRVGDKAVVEREPETGRLRCLIHAPSWAKLRRMLVGMRREERRWLRRAGAAS